MFIRIETQSRKKAKLTPYLDVLDLQLLLLSGLIVPLVVWLFTGVTWKGTIWLPFAYMAWVLKFKVGKPPGYWSHWLNHQLRGKQWSGYSNQLIPPQYIALHTTTNKITNPPK